MKNVIKVVKKKCYKGTKVQKNMTNIGKKNVTYVRKMWLKYKRCGWDTKDVTKVLIIVLRYEICNPSMKSLTKVQKNITKL